MYKVCNAFDEMYNWNFPCKMVKITWFENHWWNWHRNRILDMKNEKVKAHGQFEDRKL